MGAVVGISVNVGDGNGAMLIVGDAVVGEGVGAMGAMVKGAEKTSKPLSASSARTTYVSPDASASGIIHEYVLTPAASSVAIVISTLPLKKRRSVVRPVVPARPPL